MESISIKVFPAATNLPLWVASDCGFLQQEGLSLDIRYTMGSVEQLTELIAGQHDLVMTLFDNVVAYRCGQGEAPAEGDPDLVACFACDSGFPRLTVQPEINSFEDLRGRQLSVDAMTTGFAFLLRRLLAINGVHEHEVEFVSTGGVLQRWQAMMEGRYAATLLVTPFEIIGEQKGLKVLTGSPELFADYQGNVIATRRLWSTQNGETLAAFISAYLQALEWLFDSSNRQEAIRILLAHMPEINPHVARRACDVFLAESGGFFRDGRPSSEGIASVLALRQAYRPGAEIDPSEAYFDHRFLDTAKAG